MKKLFLIVFLLSHTIFAFQPHEVFIVVPGTWAIKAKWYKLGGNFFSALEQSVAAKGHKALWFRWLSDNYESSRQTAAQEFAHMLCCFEPATEINIIAHSHGVNVTLGACQLLAQTESTRKIKALYALAAPIYEEVYSPDMSVITRLYNLYSFNDSIQTIWGYKRIFTPKPGIINIQIFIDGKEPNHSDIHSPVVGKWLTNLAQRPCPTPGIVYFYSTKPPEVKNNPDFEKQLAQDKLIDFQSLLYLRKKTKKPQK